MATTPVVDGVFVGAASIPKLNLQARRGKPQTEQLDIATIKGFEARCMSSGHLSDGGETVSTAPCSPAEFDEVPPVLQRLDDYIDAFFTFEGEIDDTTQKRADGRYKLGDAFLNQVKDVDDAIEEFYGALDVHPRHADALCGLGAALNEQGYEEGAIEILRCALEVAPHHASAHLFLGIALYRTGDLDAAVSEYRLVVKFADEGSDAAVQAKKRLDRIEAKKAGAA
jgi:tetratricopeptide (TPR) repeat protein